MARIPNAFARWLLTGIVLFATTVTMVGCGGNRADNKIPDNPAPLPDPSQRIEG